MKVGSFVFILEHQFGEFAWVCVTLGLTIVPDWHRPAQGITFRVGGTFKVIHKMALPWGLLDKEGEDYTR